ncbi:hypothetical protein J6590_052371 [Homalodisca vitripennis]|nr:hypothetical protein J6590_052371 [Homalodisca vitripennis]
MTAEDKEGVPRFVDTMQIGLLQKTMEITYMIQDVHKLERTWQQRMRSCCTIRVVAAQYDGIKLVGMLWYSGCRPFWPVLYLPN